MGDILGEDGNDISLCEFWMKPTSVHVGRVLVLIVPGSLRARGQLAQVDRLNLFHYAGEDGRERDRLDKAGRWERTSSGLGGKWIAVLGGEWVAA